MSTITNRNRRVMHVTLAAATVCALTIIAGSFRRTRFGSDRSKWIGADPNRAPDSPFDTFGDEEYWGDVEGYIASIEGSAFGGVGPGVSPAAALAVGLKVDADALPASLVAAVRNGQDDLNSPATTLALTETNAAVGVTGFFNSDGTMKSIGIQCALCHSTVDKSFTVSGIPAGKIGHGLDGRPNRDLNVGAIVNLSPDLSAPAKLLRVDEATLRKVLLSWGPGKFDAEVFMDGKAFRPDGGTAPRH